MNDDLASLSLEELERRCPPGDLHRLRLFPKDSDIYRTMLILALTPSPELPIEELLEILRPGSSPDQTWRDAINLFKRSVPSAPWEGLAKSDIESDTRRVEAWLKLQHNGNTTATGIYLGLDTLNMKNGSGANVEIGFSKVCDPTRIGSSWAYEGLSYGESHLIGSLVPMKAEYSSNAWRPGDPQIPLGSAAAFADYMVFLGYSGLILREAFQGIKTWSSAIVIWGFHDGDLFNLARTKDGRPDFLFN